MKHLLTRAKDAEAECFTDKSLTSKNTSNNLLLFYSKLLLAAAYEKFECVAEQLGSES
jgi:hypothetical protein